jgi:hypothetical protein
MFYMHETLEPGPVDTTTPPAPVGEPAPDAPRVPDREELRKIVLELTDDLTRDIVPLAPERSRRPTSPRSPDQPEGY